MTRRKWLWATLLTLPLAIGGSFAYAASTHLAGGYVCPINGERLPCEKCCPLNDKSEGAFICPETGEELPCAKCCPLNDKQ